MIPIIIFCFFLLRKSTIYMFIWLFIWEPCLTGNDKKHRQVYPPVFQRKVIIC